MQTHRHGRHPLVLLAGLLAALVALSSETTADEQVSARRPHVLFVVVDDLNNDLGCYGHPLVQTPHLDRLAERGVRFDRAYCQFPVCNPTRASFLSGRRAGGGSPLNDAVFMPDFFSRHGYLSIEVGKMSHGYGPSARARWDRREQRFSGEKVVELLEQQADRPLFLAAGPTHTHPGYGYRREFLELYPPEKMPLFDEPADWRKQFPDALFRGINMMPDISADEHRRHLATYFAAISTLDDHIGEIMAGLDRLGLWDNTIVLFSSDHGRHLGDHGGIYDKRTLLETSVRVPLIVAAPGKQRGAVSARLVEMVDFFPTLAELCGLEPPEGMEGTSFVPLLEQPDRPWKRAAFSSTFGYARGQGVRTEHYRYAEWNDGRDAVLFDHQTDPGEYVNLADDPQHAEAIAEMRRLLAAGWQAVLPPKE